MTDTDAYMGNGDKGNTAILDQITVGLGGTRDYEEKPCTTRSPPAKPSSLAT